MNTTTIHILILFQVLFTLISSSPICNSPHCQKCIPTNPNLCAICQTGYTTNQGECFESINLFCKVNHCNKCITQKPLKCEYCEHNYKVNNFDLCTPAFCTDKNCVLCPINKDLCISCQDGFYVYDSESVKGSNGKGTFKNKTGGVCYVKCDIDISNCIHCSINEGKATKCEIC